MDDHSNQSIVILGATSAIAQATARILADKKDNLILVGRDQSKLEIVQADLLTRGAREVKVVACNLSELSEIKDIFQRILNDNQKIDRLLVAYGSLGNQFEDEQNVECTIRELEANFVSVSSWLLHFANYFQAKRSGTIAVITSVAGDRGRKKNYIYGSAKGGLNIFLQGLRNRLSSFNVRVVTIKPGFVDTPMTSHMKKGLLFASPENVAKGIVYSMHSGAEVVYLPWFWRYIMFIIKLIPENIFKKLNI